MSATRDSGRLVAASTALRMAWSAAPGATIALFTLTVASGGLPVLGAIFTRRIVNILTRASHGALMVQALLLAATLGLSALLPHVTSYLEGELQRRLGLLAQSRLFSAVASFPTLEELERPAFFDRIRLAQQAASAVPHQTVLGTFSALQAAVTVGGFLAALAAVDLRIMVAAVAAAVPALVAELRLGRKRATLLWTLSPAERRRFFYTSLQINPKAAKEIRLFGLSDFFRVRMTRELSTVNAGERRIAQGELWIQSLIAVLASVAAGVGVVLGARDVAHNDLSIGSLAVVLAGLAAIQTGAANLVSQIASINEALLRFTHYIWVERAAALGVASTPAREVTPLRTGVQFKDVWFRYAPDAPWILRAVNLNITHGQTLALVGLNGAGKSTLIKLLCGFYTPVHGRILWDNEDIRTLSPQSLRQRISAVFQDFMIYDLTLAENVAIGEVSRLNDHKAIERSIERAGLADTVARLRAGHDTLLGSLFAADPEDDTVAVRLSGGQEQRVAVARAFLRQSADLVVLDEPSAGLDPEAEHALTETLSESRRGRTTVLVSHRLNSLKNADSIAVLSEGSIIEQGSHSALMAAGKEYFRLFRLQSSGFESSTVPAGETADRDALDVGHRYETPVA